MTNDPEMTKVFRDENGREIVDAETVKARRLKYRKIIDDKMWELICNDWKPK